jgi:4-aminobutyrate aminotransferase-like enzyme
VLAFSGGYHGMSLGALGVSGYRDAFRQPFASFAGRQELRLPYANPDDCVFACATCDQRCLRTTAQLLGSDVSGAEDIAAIIVEPIQARGGDVVPPKGWLRALQTLAHDAGALLIVDEIYTGFGRTGDWFASEREGVVPDLLVVGKALGGGLPISACIGTPEIMNAWGASAGEAIHTMTFLGNPMSAAAGLAVLDVLEEEALVSRAATEGAWLAERLDALASSRPRVRAVRGRGMMWGIALQQADGSAWAGGGVEAMHALLRHGFIVSPGGPAGDVISVSPPLVITREQLAAGIDAIEAWLDELA